jgi:hypothetical protein
MNYQYKHTLWSDPGRSRFFLVPKNEELTSGDYPVRTITGLKNEVDLDSLIRFEVSREQASDWLKSEFSTAIDEAKKGFMDTLVRNKSEPPEWSVAAKRKKKEDTTASGTVAPEPGANTNQADKQYNWDAWIDTLDRFGAIIERSIPTAIDSRTNQRDQAAELRSLLEGYDLDAKENPEIFFDYLQQWLSTQKNTDGLQENAVQLERLAEGIDNAASKISKRLRSMAEELREQNEDIDK